ncbi:serine/threonine-protein kinase [Keratinibaculum paraultunense]|uniref:non-specific serine/threonine protein kinase n=1 Tax=Keratinibaculum paraultunense TaxID=1278232 RepID=A0A4V2UU82_9FIRM|nr:Stk1 family PASTA domain-containing Ser/Thr kinase [Keratinibaculum paraultunense]QQY80783.1 Stk1 family PASTA domain-containing Ser/Thr kinase [Keratinibaculum paraultunense]TCS89605.1 serine/threonine-protein kinase [Keratinibaculum paraultunense]
MIGTVLGNRYEIIEKIGEGGMACVYKARCRLLNRNVAVKVLREEFVDDEDFIKKFKRESQAAASLSHPNIVNVYDVGVEKIGENFIHYIVMEYIKGKTLKEIIKEKGKLSVEETLDYSIQIAEALEHAHKNHIVHRDIKPHNIMVTDDGRVKVTDFGIARAATTSTVTTSTNVIGSVHYFSPEQARGGYTDEKSDIYSLGIVMYEMITGKVPYEGDSPISIALKHIEGEIEPPRKIDSTVPIGLEKIIMKCVQKNQFDRYQSAGELLYDLKKLKYSCVDDFIENTSIIDSPTQIMSNIQIENEDEEDLKGRKGKKKKNKGENSLKPILLAILLAFIVTGFVAFSFFKFKDLFVVAETVVPDLVGMHVDVAEEELEKQGLKLKIYKEIYDNEFEEGEIVSQNVKAGEKVKKGFTIGVTISKGSKLVKVPNLINKNITEVDAILREYNLDEGEVKYDYSDTVEANIIMNQFPEPYTEVEANTKIDLIVSKGPKSKPVLMPKLVGLKEKDAENALKSFNLKRGQRIEKPSDEYPEGYVIWQSIEPGVAVEPNTSVDIYISTGPEKVPEEEPEDEDVNSEVPFNLKLTLPQDGTKVEIRIDRVQDGVSETVYEKVHIADGNTVKIPLKGKLDAQFEIYFNGIHNETFPHPDKQ